MWRKHIRTNPCCRTSVLQMAEVFLFLPFFSGKDLIELLSFGKRKNEWVLGVKNQDET
jgi:hypothetical protein